MAKYLLKITGSDDIINIVEWNETGSIEAPSGFVFEPFVTGSTDFINYITDTTQSTLPYFYGEIDGYFTGELTGSITYNGKTLEEFINDTEYGSIKIISGSNVSSSIQFGLTSVISENNVILPVFLNNSGSTYNKILNRITDENISNYLLKFKLDQNTELQYLINQTIFTSSGEFNYYNLDAVLQSTSSLNGNTFQEYFNIANTHGSHWYVDFDLGDKPIVGQVYVNGEKLETKLIDQTGFGMLRYDDSQDVSQSPHRSYFRFDVGADDYNGYYWWNNVTPTKIVLNVRNYDRMNDYSDGVGKYMDILLEIIGYSFVDSVLTLRQVDIPIRYKSFKIKNGTYYERTSNDQSPISYFKLDWGNGLYPSGGEVFSGYSKFSHIELKSPGLYNDPYEREGYFYFEVEEIQSEDSLTAGLAYGDPFIIDIIKNNPLEKKRKEIHVITSPIDFTIPNWVDDITMYAVGAGGGGGGGASGYGHADTISYNYDEETVSELTGYQTVTGGGGGAGGSVSISKFNTKSGIINKGDILNIIVSPGGRGGIGSSFINEMPKTDETIVNRFYQSHPIQNNFIGWMTYYVYGFTPNGALYNGKKGGNTQVFSKATGDLLISADGGYGGAAGYGSRNYYSLFHVLCGKVGHNAGDYYVPGGGSSIKKSVGNEIRPGGHGAYGIAMVGITQVSDNVDAKDFDTLTTKRDYPIINTGMYKLNVAPNIPWDDKTNKSIRSLKLPYGHTSDNINDDSVLDVRSVGLKSTLKPIKVAPGGGGGGTGFTWHGVDTRNFNDSHGFDEMYNFPNPSNREDIPYTTSALRNRHNRGFPGNVIPNDFMQVTAAKVSSRLAIGFGGTNVANGRQTVSDLIDDYDSTGTRYIVRVGNGGNGGSLSIAMGTAPGMVEPGITLPNQFKVGDSYELGYGWGGGGGGGAYIKNFEDRNNTGNEELYPTKGQDGGDGGAGVLVIVLEQK